MNEENKKESLGVRVKSAAKKLMVHITESQIVSSCVYRRRFNVRTLGVYGATGGINKAATSVGFLFGLLEDAVSLWRVGLDGRLPRTATRLSTVDVCSFQFAATMPESLLTSVTSKRSQHSFQVQRTKQAVFW